MTNIKRLHQPTEPGEIVIERGIPLPKNNRWKRYPFAEMKVGDSFFVPSKKSCNAGFYYGKRHNMKFTVRQENGGCRVWRVR